MSWSTAQSTKNKVDGNRLIIIRSNLQLESNSPQSLSRLGNDSISNEAKIRSFSSVEERGTVSLSRSDSMFKTINNNLDFT